MQGNTIQNMFNIHNNVFQATNIKLDSSLATRVGHDITQSHSHHAPIYELISKLNLVLVQTAEYHRNKITKKAWVSITVAFTSCP